MVISKYSFPLPNNGDRYDLSQNELVELLDNAYNCGFEHARDVYDLSRQGMVTWVSTMKKCQYHCDYSDGKYCHYKGKKDCVNY